MGVDLRDKVFWACSSTKTYKLQTVKATCLCPNECACDLASPKEARLIHCLKELLKIQNKSMPIP